MTCFIRLIDTQVFAVRPMTFDASRLHISLLIFHSFHKLLFFLPKSACTSGDLNTKKRGHRSIALNAWLGPSILPPRCAVDVLLQPCRRGSEQQEVVSECKG